MSPLVSVIMAAKNEELFIEQAITSILDQTIQNIELIVVDDGSTDRTSEIVKSIANVDSRVHLFCGKGEGPASARSIAIRHSLGKYIMIMDADDISAPDRIEVLLAIACKNDLSMIGSNVEIIRADGTVAKRNRYPKSNAKIRAAFGRYYNRSALIPGTILANKELYIQNPYNLSMKYLEDWDFVLRVAENPKVVFENCQDFLYKYRLNSNSVSFDWRNRNRYNVMILCDSYRRKHGLQPFGTLESFEQHMSGGLLRASMYKMLLLFKFIQHNLWRIKMKHILDVK